MWDSVKDYIRILRIDYWPKNVFVLPGYALAVVLSDVGVLETAGLVVIGLLSVCFTASANYVINEWLDAETDRYHPEKKHRPSVDGRVKGHYVLLEYALVAAAGIGLASQIGVEFLYTAIALLIMGVLYNVRPFRTKDRVYLDVLSESVNNPLRLLLGWFVVMHGVMPPSSVILAYWMGGAFLMAVKRYAEYRFIGDPELAALYRRSFRFYSEEKLLLSAFFYALVSVFFLGVFLIKYRVEFVLSFPLFTLLFVWYLKLSMDERSTARSPERIYQAKTFIAYVVFLCLVVAFLFVVDIPFLHMLTESVQFDGE